MSQCSFNSSDRGEGSIAFPAQFHICSSDDGHDDIISTQQAISINMNDDEDTVVMSEPAFDTHHDTNSKTEDSGIESHPECGWASEYSIISTAEETLDGSGINSDAGSSDCDIAQPYKPTDIDDAYASDDSCASHDSFVANLFATSYHPPISFYRPGYSPYTKKKAEDRPTSDTMRVVPKKVSYSRLEMLPPEMRIQILMSMPDLETLHSFISASPTMHTQYLYSRHNILSACLGRELEASLSTHTPI